MEITLSPHDHMSEVAISARPCPPGRLSLTRGLLGVAQPKAASRSLTVSRSTPSSLG